MSAAAVGNRVDDVEQLNPYQWQNTLAFEEKEEREGRFPLTDSDYCVMAFLKATVLKIGAKTLMGPPEIDFISLLKGLTAQERADERRQQEERAAERQKLRANCAAIYVITIDRKVSDLTVRETEQVQACKALGLYSGPPKSRLCQVLSVNSLPTPAVGFKIAVT